MPLPERTPEFAERIARLEYADKHAYTTWRGAQEYLAITEGALVSVLEIARRKNKKLAIIGVGWGRAAYEIAHGRDVHGKNLADLGIDGRDLSILATGLTPPDDLYRSLGPNVRFAISPVEELEYVRNGEKFGAIIGVNSVAYALPDQAVEQIDKALEPGGVFLGTFRNHAYPSLRRDIPDFQTVDPFIKQFTQLGYDIARVVSSYGLEYPEVLLAIKPGGTMRAEVMLRTAQGWLAFKTGRKQ
jgi:SAM-dependent methyltransferase